MTWPTCLQRCWWSAKHKHTCTREFASGRLCTLSIFAAPQLNLLTWLRRYASYPAPAHMAAESKHRMALCRHIENFMTGPSFLPVCTLPTFKSSAEQSPSLAACWGRPRRKHNAGPKANARRESDLVVDRPHQPLQAEDDGEIHDLLGQSWHGIISVEWQPRLLIHWDPLVRSTRAEVCRGALVHRRAWTRGQRPTSATKTCVKSDIGVIPGFHSKSAGETMSSASQGGGDMGPQIAILVLISIALLEAGYSIKLIYNTCLLAW